MTDHDTALTVISRPYLSLLYQEHLEENYDKDTPTCVSSSHGIVPLDGDKNLNYREILISWPS